MDTSKAAKAAAKAAAKFGNSKVAQQAALAVRILPSMLGNMAILLGTEGVSNFAPYRPQKQCLPPVRQKFVLL